MHLQEGSFRHGWLLLDDPAQEMDQPTYRDLCRLLATILRLYVHEKKQFTLMLLLHREDRALDAARETHAGLRVLGWMLDQTDQNRWKENPRQCEEFCCLDLVITVPGQQQFFQKIPGLL
jgi:hypothetical protein